MSPRLEQPAQDENSLGPGPHFFMSFFSLSVALGDRRTLVARIRTSVDERWEPGAETRTLIQPVHRVFALLMSDVRRNVRRDRGKGLG
jgi:hypothetical protein